MVDALTKPNNTFGVSKRQWKEWTFDACNLFNDLFATSKDNQKLFLHPETDHIYHAHWNTIAWNHAWLAADYVSMRQKGTVKI